MKQIIHLFVRSWWVSLFTAFLPCEKKIPDELQADSEVKIDWNSKKTQQYGLGVEPHSRRILALIKAEAQKGGSYSPFKIL